MEQIEILANFIMAEVEGEPSRSEGAGDTGIRIIKQLQAELAEQPEPTEFMKEIRELARGYGGNINAYEVPPPLMILADRLGKSCTVIGRQAAENKAQAEEIERLLAENKQLKSELKASDNWLHRLLKSCVLFLDDGEVTKRAVEKQSRYNQQALENKS